MDVKAHSLGLCKTFRCLPDSRYVTACVVLYISISRKLAKNPHAPRQEQPKKRKQGLCFCQQIIVILIHPPKMILILISPSKMTLMRIQFRNYHGLLVLLHNQPPLLVAARVIWIEDDGQFFAQQFECCSWKVGKTKGNYIVCVQRRQDMTSEWKFVVCDDIRNHVHTPAQLMRPDFGRNASCAMGDFAQHLGLFLQGRCGSLIIHVYKL